MLTLDLDGTLTNSKKEITPATKEALIEIQKNGKIVVLASGRPTYGVLPLARELELHKYGGYVLGFNGGQITNCHSKTLIYNKLLPGACIAPIFEKVKEYAGATLITYRGDEILAGMEPNQYSELESRINHMPIHVAEDFPAEINFPVNKLLATGEPELMEVLEKDLKKAFHSELSIYRSDPFFVEIMPQKIDKAYSLHRLVSSIRLKADNVICCGDGYNDLTMIEYAGLGVAMENAQPRVRDSADYITKSNDEDGVLHVIREFMMD
jgi:hypothetical protein